MKSVFAVLILGCLLSFNAFAYPSLSELPSVLQAIHNDPTTHIPAPTSSSNYVLVNGQKVSPQSLLSGHCGETISTLNASASAGVSYSLNNQNFTTNQSAQFVDINCEIKKLDTNYGDGDVRRETLISAGKRQYFQVEEIQQCDINTIYTYAYGVDETLYCTTGQDMNDYDSCPDSLSDENYVLPVNYNNLAPTLCQAKPDGSLCKYNLGPQNGYYVSDFEGDCYSFGEVNNPYIPPDEEIELPPTDSCSDIGNGVYACSESRENVCDATGRCESGCGTFGLGDQSAFICLSGDIDNDGLADYADPDKDGDGIPNDDDLDSDGDGQDDPTYPTDNAQFSSASIEALLAKANGLLQSIDANTSGSSGSQGNLGVIEAIEKIEKVEFTTEAGARVADAFDALYGPEDIAEVQALATAKETEFKTYIQTIRSEASALFTLNRPAANWEARTITIKGVTHDISFARFSSTFAIVGTVVIFLAALGSLAILLGGKK